MESSVFLPHVVYLSQALPYARKSPALILEVHKLFGFVLSFHVSESMIAECNLANSTYRKSNVFFGDRQFFTEYHQIFNIICDIKIR